MTVRDIPCPARAGLLLLAPLAGLGAGYFDDYVVPDPHHHGHHGSAVYSAPALPQGAPPPQYVTTPPPPPQYEPPLACGAYAVPVPGSWQWNGAAWAWRPGFCGQPPSGYQYVAPSYGNGHYVHGHWGPAHHDDHHDDHH